MIQMIQMIWYSGLTSLLGWKYFHLLRLHERSEGMSCSQVLLARSVHATCLHIPELSHKGKLTFSTMFRSSSSQP